MLGVPGVKTAKVDLKTKSVIVVFDDAAATVEAIAAASANVGYPAKLPATDARKTQ